MFFKRKKQKEEKQASARMPIRDAQKEQRTSTTSPKKQAFSGAQNLASVLRNPRITEKATENTMRRVYIFDVAPEANKRQIADSVRSVYKVEPLKVRVVPVPHKRIRHARTGIMGVKGGGKKAYVYLKEGDTISVV